MAVNPLKKLAGQTAIYGLPTILGRLLNYLLVPLYTRVFVPAEYGVVTELYAYVAFLFVILTYGMETSFFRFAAQDNNRSTVVGTSIVSLFFTSLLFLALVLPASSFIAGLMDYSNHPEYIRWFSLILAADAMTSIPYANLRLENKPLRFALIKIVNIGSNIGFNLFFIVLCPYLSDGAHQGWWSPLIQLVYNTQTGVGYIFISNLIASFITFLMLVPGIPWRRLGIDTALLRKMLNYGWPLLIFGLAGIVNETFDRLILKHLLPDKANAMVQLGIYGACYKVSILMTLFIQTYRYAAEPFFFDQASSKNARETYASMMHYFIVVCLFIFLAIMLYIDLVMLFVGRDFREGAGVVPVLLLANLFLGVFYNLSVWFKLTDKTKAGAAISIAGAAITLVLNFILIPIWGYMGAAWATLICYVSMMLISYLIGQRYYPVNYDLRRAGWYVLMAALIYMISLWSSNLQPLVRYMTNTMLLAAFVAYALISEKQRFRQLANKAI